VLRTFEDILLTVKVRAVAPAARVKVVAKKVLMLTFDQVEKLILALYLQKHFRLSSPLYTKANVFIFLRGKGNDWVAHALRIKRQKDE
jgi:hypothetical protein